MSCPKGVDPALYKGGFLPGSAAELHHAEMVDRYASGRETLQQIADHFGLTKARVHQIIEIADPEAKLRRDRIRAALREAAQAAEHERRRRAWEAEGHRCRVCAQAIPYSPSRPGRKPVATCGGECAAIWVHLRFLLDETQNRRHRRAVAAWGVRHTEAHTTSAERAAAVAAGAPVKDHGRWFIPGSAKHRAACVAVARGYEPVIQALTYARQIDQVRHYLATGVFSAESRVAV